MKNFKTEWNFKLFYKSDNDPQIKKDIIAASNKIDAFAKKYSSNKNFLKNNQSLLKALDEYERVLNQKELSKPLVYFMLRRDKDSSNKYVETQINKLEEIYSKNYNKVLFFYLELGKIPAVKQKQILTDKKLEKYHYFLKQVFENAKYNLEEGEEKVMNLMSQPGYSMWQNSVSKILSQKEIKFKNKNISLGQAMNLLASENASNRKILDKQIKEKWQEVADFSEAEINAIYTSKKIQDELRGYEKPYSATILNYENEDKTVENLVEAVTENFKLSKRFYKAKAKMMSVDKLNYYDRAATVGKIKRKFDFDNTKEIIANAFAKIDQKYSNIFNDYLKNGQIDVYPKKGKTSGAYCFGSEGNPTFVLLNHTDDLNSVTTLAHEMGHAFHTEFSQKQDPIYRDYTMSVAEVASTFFENFVWDELFDSLSNKEKVIALHDKIDSQISTIFRQIACFNFENELHLKIRELGYLPKEEIAKLLNKHMKSYMGPVVNFEESDGYQFISWSHIRRHFYVYSYASGALISNALYSRYKEDSSYLEKIEQFLSAGGSKSPEDIFADAGINIRDKKFFEDGLKIIEKDIKKLEKLINN